MDLTVIFEVVRVDLSALSMESDAAATIFALPGEGRPATLEQKPAASCSDRTCTRPRCLLSRFALRALNMALHPFATTRQRFRILRGESCRYCVRNPPGLKLSQTLAGALHKFS